MVIVAAQQMACSVTPSLIEMFPSSRKKNVCRSSQVNKGMFADTSHHVNMAWQ
jgi:hypothetical protein